MSLDLSQLPFAASVPAGVRRVFAAAQLLHDDVEVERAVDRVAVRMTVDLQDCNPLLISVLPAGFVFAGMLLRRLVFPLQFSFLSINGEGVITPAPGMHELLQQRPVVVLDGCIDDVRAATVQDWLAGNGAGSVTLAALLDAGRANAQAVCYSAFDDHPEGLFGSGLDYQGYGANLPGVYAVTR